MKKIITFLGLSALSLFLIPQFSHADFECSDNVSAKYESAVNWAIAEGVLKGNADGTCKLDSQVNRIAFAVMAMRGTIGDDDAQAESCNSGLFNDVKDDQCKGWYGRYAATAKAQGILKGDKSGNLRANDPVNAAEAAVIAARAYELEPYPSVAGDSWYDPTFKLFDDHYVKTYSASHSMTRGEVVQMMFEIYMNYDILTDTGGGADHSSNTNNNNTVETPAVNTNSNTNTSAGFTVPANSANSFRYFVENLEFMSSADVAAVIRSLNSTQQLQLSIYTAFASWAHQIGCQADPNLIMDIRGATNCLQTAQGWQSSLSFVGSWEAALSEARLQQGTILIGAKCATGEIDAGSCSAYTGFQQSYTNISGEIGQSIVDNFSNACDSPGTYLPDGSYCAYR